MKRSLDTLIALESTLPLDKAAINAAQDKVDALIKADRDLRLDMDIAIVNILNDGQKRKLAEELAKKPEHGKDKHDGKHDHAGKDHKHGPCPCAENCPCCKQHKGKKDKGPKGKKGHR